MSKMNVELVFSLYPYTLKSSYDQQYSSCKQMLFGRWNTKRIYTIDWKKDSAS